MKKDNDETKYEDELYCVECGALLDRRDERCYRCGSYQDS